MLISLFVVVVVDDVVVVVVVVVGVLFFFLFYRPKWGLLSMQCETRSFFFSPPFFLSLAYRPTE